MERTDMTTPSHKRCRPLRCELQRLDEFSSAPPVCGKGYDFVARLVDIDHPRAGSIAVPLLVEVIALGYAES